MDKLTRLYKLHQVLQSHHLPVPMRVIQERLECSRATANRVIQELRDYFNAPLEYSREANGYHYVGEQAFHLPGLWFSDRELLALLTFEQLLGDLGPGLLGNQLAPFSAKIRTLLANQGITADSEVKRIAIGSVARRPFSPAHFSTVAEATRRRRQVKLIYHNRWNGETNERTVSPQRLMHYRDNWYLEAWCHTREDLRTFSLDRMLAVEILAEAATEIDAETMNARFATSYGIYSGKPSAWAVLRFSERQANWVIGEQWHPDQKASFLTDGRYELQVPYSQIGEIIKEILSHAEHVEVVSPSELREEVKRRLEAAVKVYQVLRQ